MGSRRFAVLLRTVAIALSALPACAPAAAPSEEGHASAVSHQFFENAKRRDATESEASRVATFGEAGCTAFFLENTAKKVYLATARHCFEFKIEEWCSNDGALSDNLGGSGQCTRLVATDAHHDIAVFEADIAHPSTGDTTLKLASYVPKIGAKLTMTGYPQDEDPRTARRGMLTTTDSCWILSGAMESPYVGVDDDVTLDKAALHNCSTYGGNSGGPMYIEGTRDVIGLPFTYEPDDYNRRSSTDLETAASVALMADFVELHRTELKAAGIVIATPTTKAPTPAETDADPKPGADEDESSPASASETAEPKTAKASDEDPEADDDNAAMTPSRPRTKASPGAAAPAAMGCSMARPASGTSGWPLVAIVVGGVLSGVRRRRKTAARAR